MSGNVPDYQYAPPPSTDPPPPSNPMAATDAPPPQPSQYQYPQYQAGTGYYGQYPSTYHPQYGTDQPKQQTTNVIVHQQVCLCTCVCVCACVRMCMCVRDATIHIFWVYRYIDSLFCITIQRFIARYGIVCNS